MLAVFLSLFLVVRTVALEPFGVPTGSMAPTLFGNHREARCPRCDYRVVVGEPGPEARPVRFDNCRCPNCGQAVDLSNAREVPGDRLMVDKSAYQARPPRRWEAAVFRCPVDLSKPYVKRVVGLPGELIHVSGGDVYADGQLLRKTLAQFRQVRIPVFDMTYAPPDGWGVRWLVEPVATAQKPAPTRDSGKPADESILRDDALVLDGTGTPEGIGLTYRHWNLDTKEQEAVGDWLGYNGGPSERRNGFARRRPVSAPDPVHDFAVEFDLEVVAGAGVFALRLTDGTDSVRADLPINHDPASVAPIRVTRDDSNDTVDGVTGLTPGRTYRVEFALVDRRVSLAIDGKEVVASLDLPFDPPTRARRGGMSRPLQIGVQGASVVVRNLRLFRDIHYLSVGKAGDGWQLGKDEYFVLGDNTSNSHDSRLWMLDGSPVPGVPEADFIGKPFLIHQPLRLGRIGFTGKERVIQTLDWSRLQWLR
jgi:signal peptidase I